MAILRSFLHEVIVFGLKEARACIFPACFFVILVLSRFLSVPGISRYDWIFLSTVCLQIALFMAGIESKADVLVLASFHMIGLVLEIFKTRPSIGSWRYPEEGVIRIGIVPLYSGFMYAAVASYMCQAWRLLDLELSKYPSYKFSIPLSIAIYLNFFTHHVIPDMRWMLLLGVVLLFWRTEVPFKITYSRRAMPLVFAFVCIGFFIWIAENIATCFGAWVYPEQALRWILVSPGKINSWFLLVIISFLIVADLNMYGKAGMMILNENW